MANGQAMPTVNESGDQEPSSKKSRYSDKDVKNMPSKQYMDELVVPTMLRALSAVNKERPEDPIEFLIAYLSKERERSESPMDQNISQTIAGDGTKETISMTTATANEETDK